METFVVKSCCGKKNIMLKFNFPLSQNTISKLVDLKFEEQKHFTEVGLLYVTNKNFILTGTMGSTTLTVKFRNDSAEQEFPQLEKILKTL